MRKHEVPRQDRVRAAQRFGWVDHALYLNGYLKEMSHSSQSLYLFLCIAANRDGVSWYSDAKIRDVTGLEADELQAARRELIDMDLVAFESPWFQVLSVPYERRVARQEVLVPEATQATAATQEEVSRVVADIQRKLRGGER
ncbi:MAG: hypothetical protein GY800_06635 [Planctomycetes bacterium]|nr:hypothetical protein [Planctomycetota bacterium]